ncbi:MAG: hypothetical protein KGY99_05080 [Phycisphaerae bacterium]|nr:hypothetical protein [Phycisphaerae bacterium]
MRYATWLAMALLATAATVNADEPTTRPAGDAPDTVRFKHIRIDRKAERIVFDARVVLREGPLELLVCRRQSKEHESILATPAKAAHLHALLLALGLTPGRSAHWSDEGPEPTFQPPRGPEVKIKLRWMDKDGKTRQVNATDWIQPTDETAKAPPNKWVFVGSQILANGRYWADVDGDVVSLANFASAVIDVPFESTAEDAALEFEARTEAIPPRKTPVEVIVEPLPGARKSPYASKLLEIDRFGEMRIDGRTIPLDRLDAWARAYIEKHPKGFVHIRAEGRARVADVGNAISGLWLGGLRDYEVQRLRLAMGLLPRTDTQLEQALAPWADKLARADKLLLDPRDEARAVLKQIDSELGHMERRRELLNQYADHLRALLEEHDAPQETP